MIQKEIDLGPIHPWLPGMMKLNVSLEGDRIVTAKPEFGFSGRRIIEKSVDQPVGIAQRYLSRIEPEGAFVTDRIFSELVEKATDLQVTGRARWIRDIAIEMSESVNVLKYLSQMAVHLGLPMLSHLVLKHREELLDLMERLSGSRYGYFYIIPGGTRYDITDGFLERVGVWSRQFVADYPRIQSLFNWTHRFQNRLEQLGLMIDDGSYGFISEARVETSNLGWNSSVGSRLNYAIEESLHLAESIFALSQKIESGAFLSPLPDKVTVGRVAMKFETLRGPWDVAIELDPKLVLRSIQVQTPSDQIKNAIPMILEEEAFDDIPMILGSANFSVTEVDR
jgi:NADH:ubiquinone oxidoreductase subunit D